MDIDLQGMNRAELERLRKQVDETMDNLEKQQIADARQAAADAVKAYGFSLGDIFDFKEESGKKKNPPKYRNPDDTSMTWTGRGRQPSWIKEGLENGKDLEDFRI